MTGASRGIGLGIARMLARRGFALTLAARDSAGLVDVAAEVAELGPPPSSSAPPRPGAA